MPGAGGTYRHATIHTRLQLCLCVKSVGCRKIAGSIPGTTPQCHKRRALRRTKINSKVFEGWLSMIVMFLNIQMAFNCSFQ